MLECLSPGLETSIQDYPGRLGFLDQGLPPSGPMDSWSFRLANALVGNHPGTAALECQYLGPTLRFDADAWIGIAGADMRPTLDDAPIDTWSTVHVRSGQVLKFAAAKSGARAYLAIAGGLDVPEVMASRATFHKAAIGGANGHALKKGQVLKWAAASTPPTICRIKQAARPVFSEKVWDVEVVAGPNDDWIDEDGHRRFLSSDWKLTAKSDRTGFRLEGPEWTFSRKAYDKTPENGSMPSNIIDHGYPLGAINLAGQTPIILVHDGPSMGGFINPYTVPSAALWKLGQSRPGDIYRFRAISVADAQKLAREQTSIVGASSLEPL
jgi:urea carboxylase